MAATALQLTAAPEARDGVSAAPARPVPSARYGCLGVRQLNATRHGDAADAEPRLHDDRPQAAAREVAARSSARGSVAGESTVQPLSPLRGRSQPGGRGRQAALRSAVAPVRDVPGANERVGERLGRSSREGRASTRPEDALTTPTSRWPRLAATATAFADPRPAAAHRFGASRHGRGWIRKLVAAIHAQLGGNTRGNGLHSAGASSCTRSGGRPAVA